MLLHRHLKLLALSCLFLASPLQAASFIQVKACINSGGQWKGDIQTGFCDRSQRQWLKRVEQCVAQKKTWKGPIGPGGQCL